MENIIRSDWDSWKPHAQRTMERKASSELLADKAHYQWMLGHIDIAQCSGKAREYAERIELVESELNKETRRNTLSAWKEAVARGEVIDHHASHSYIVQGANLTPPYRLEVFDPKGALSSMDVNEDTSENEVDAILTKYGINDDQWTVDTNFNHWEVQ